jgi:hypothetical protein
MLLEAEQYFTDVCLVFFGILGEDKNIVEVNNYELVEDIGKYGIHKTLKVAGVLVRPKCMTIKSNEL